MDKLGRHEKPGNGNDLFEMDWSRREVHRWWMDGLQRLKCLMETIWKWSHWFRGWPHSPSLQFQSGKPDLPCPSWLLVLSTGCVEQRETSTGGKRQRGQNRNVGLTRRIRQDGKERRQVGGSVQEGEKSQGHGGAGADEEQREGGQICGGEERGARQMLTLRRAQV